MNGGLSIVLYHGTSEKRWAMPGSPIDGLYVTDCLEVARHYANEWHEYQGETPLVLAFELSALQRFDDLKFNPNWETVDQYRNGYCAPVQDKTADDLTWMDTLAINGTFSILGFGESHKLLAVKIEPAHKGPNSSASLSV